MIFTKYYNSFEFYGYDGSRSENEMLAKGIVPSGDMFGNSAYVGCWMLSPEVEGSEGVDEYATEYKVDNVGYYKFSYAGRSERIPFDCQLSKERALEEAIRRLHRLRFKHFSYQQAQVILRVGNGYSMQVTSASPLIILEELQAGADNFQTQFTKDGEDLEMIQRVQKVLQDCRRLWSRDEFIDAPLTELINKFDCEYFHVDVIETTYREGAVSIPSSRNEKMRNYRPHKEHVNTDRNW